MKMTRIALAMLVAAPFAAANAGVTVTPLMLGYHMYPSQADKKLSELYGTTNQDVKDDLVVGGAIGAELTPAIQAEVEYQQTKTDVVDKAMPADKADVKHETASLNFITTTDAFTKNYDSKIKPYGLLGGGWSRFNVEGVGATKDTIGNVGLGALWHLNDALSLRTEARGVHNFDQKFWSAQGLAALQVVLGGHLKPQAEVVEVAPVPVAPPVAPVAPPVQVVEQPKRPQVLTEDLKMELRVFFDTNKSNIKPQYRPEIAKVADALSAFPNATAQIEGHTDNTGPRKLNERLSLARANSVKAALVNEFGVDANRLTTQGFAWDQPIADNKTREGRAMNRRVFANIRGSRTVTVPAQ